MEKIKHKLRLREQSKTASQEMSFSGHDMFLRAKLLFGNSHSCLTNFQKRSKKVKIMKKEISNLASVKKQMENDLGKKKAVETKLQK